MEELTGRGLVESTDEFAGGECPFEKGGHDLHPNRTGQGSETCRGRRWVSTEHLRPTANHLPCDSAALERSGTGVHHSSAFAVVLGTLVVQGLTLRPLILSLGLKDEENPVAAEAARARIIAYRAAGLFG